VVNNIAREGRSFKSSSKMKEIKITTEFIKLDSFLKWCGEFEMGSDAKMFILNGNVKVNGEVELRRGRKLRNGDIVEIHNEQYKVIQ